MTLTQKQKNLESHLKDLGRVVVAFSGGADSALVLAMSQKVLGNENVLAVTAESESLAERELLGAQKVAAELGVEHLILRTHEMDSPEYRANPINRCYHCKSELYSRLQAIAEKRNITHMVNGINQDDLGDHRPGIIAAREFGVLSPLSQAGFNKNDVRELSRQLGLTTSEKPAMPCLSSRVPYGEPISPEKLAMIEQAEDLLLSLGFTQLRVRHHGEIARIELLKEEMPEFLADAIAETVQQRFKQIGFKYVTLDLEGFRSGRLNDGLKEIDQERAEPCFKSN
ncbi:MAG: ATP-dependent sacrificial sulfur transferase LarE [Nitrospinae bacterium]|nr:ATP-dependent sacrificial sulfur transferase LarE [Nitrospinota bacterium]MDA1109429.1 ATP-dependent sacrificial sulfur transferase LarE [Nitrospinota bacterium]